MLSPKGKKTTRIKSLIRQAHGSIRGLRASGRLFTDKKKQAPGRKWAADHIRGYRKKISEWKEQL
jgi:hypothetical protein